MIHKHLRHSSVREFQMVYFFSRFQLHQCEFCNIHQYTTKIKFKTTNTDDCVTTVGPDIMHNVNISKCHTACIILNNNRTIRRSAFFKHVEEYLLFRGQ